MDLPRAIRSIADQHSTQHVVLLTSQDDDQAVAAIQDVIHAEFPDARIAVAVYNPVKGNPLRQLLSAIRLAVGGGPLVRSEATHEAELSVPLLAYQRVDFLIIDGAERLTNDCLHFLRRDTGQMKPPALLIGRGRRLLGKIERDQVLRSRMLVFVRDPHAHEERTRSNDQMVTVSYYWRTNKIGTHPRYASDPVLQIEQVKPPRRGQDVTVYLPSPATVGQIPPVVVAKGTVVEVRPNHPAAGHVEVWLDRIGETGLTYQELCACIGVQVVGFHPQFGGVEGELIGLHPKAELAGIRDESLAQYLIDPDEDADDKDDPVVWVDWSSVWPSRAAG